MAESQTNIGVNAVGDIHAHKIKVVQNIKPADPPAKNVRFKVEKPIQTFIGREKFLEELHKEVKEGQVGGKGGVTVLAQDLSVVAATGGIGKTETVRRYIQLHGHEYDHIIWIDAEENSFAQRQFLQLATELKISTDFQGKQKEFESILKEIFGKLLFNAHVVLLVFDNAEALDDDEELNLSGIRSLRPKSLSPFFVEPTIIVTSRNQNWGIQKVIQLDLWTEAEVVIFVIRRLGLDNKSENETLALKLGTLFSRLPIALQAAVAVILQQIKRKKKYGIQSLIDEYEKGSRKVLTQKPFDANMRPEQTSITMLVLWNISMEKIVRFEDGKLAIKILCFMAYMSSTRIPLDFLYALFKNSVTEDTFENGIEILEDYSLISSLSSEDSDCRSLSIHRMIQDSTIENLRTRAKKGLKPHVIFNDTTFLNENEVLLKLSAESVNYLNTFTNGTLPRSEELVETLVQITNRVCDKLDVKECRHLTVGTAELLRVTNNFSKSLELFERALKATPSGDGIEIAEKMSLQRALAFAYREGGHFQKSLDLYLNLLEVLAPAFGPHHEYTLDSKFNVAVALQNLGRYGEATEMYRDILQGYVNNGDSQSAGYLRAKSSFAALLLVKGENEEASAFLTEVLKKQEKDLDLNSLNIITTKWNITVKLRHEDHSEEASKMLLQIIEDATKLLGPAHPFTLQCRRDYASELHHQGKHDLAVPLLLEILETEEAQLGADHRYTLTTKLSLGVVYLATKELDKAEALLDVQVREKVFGPEHPETLDAATVLYNVKEEQGKLGDALALCEKILKVRKNGSVPNPKATLATMHKISVLHFKMSDYEKAAQVAQELLEREEEVLGKDHPNASKTLKLLTWCVERHVTQNNLTMTFMAMASVDAKTGKSLLKDSNWNLKAALDTYSHSNPSQSRTLTAAQIGNNLVRIFMALTGVNAETGKSILQASGWNLDDALEAFFGSTSDENIADVDLKEHALSRSAEATDPEHQNAATVSCNETEVNQIQDVKVQVESVAESNQPTTSILFCLEGGTRFRGQFGVSSTVKDLYKFVNEKRPHFADCNYVLTLYPNIQLTTMEETLDEAKIPKNVALTLKLLKNKLNVLL